MSKIATVKQQPGEKRRYGIDYKEALDVGDELISITAVVEPPAEMTALATADVDKVRIVCAGGATGTTYKVTLTLTTTDSNEIIEDEFYVKVKEI